MERTAEEADGPSFQAISAVAAEAKVAILYGYNERCITSTIILLTSLSEAGTIYNSLICVSNEGKLLLNYRKTHLWGAYEKDIFVPGSTLAPLIEIAGKIFFSCLLTIRLESWLHDLF